MTYITTPGFAGVDLTSIDVVPVAPLGTEVLDSDGNTWKYLRADAATLAGEAHYVEEDGSTAGTWVRTSSNPAGAMGICFAQHAVTYTEYGWYIVKGINFLGQGKSANTTADAKAYSSATASQFDGDPTGHDLIQGLRPNATGADTTDISCSSAGYAEINAQT